MRRVLPPGFPLLLSAALALAAASSPCAAAGRWTTFARPYRYTDLLAQGDTIWCGTLESGLLRFLRTDSTFQVITREPSGLASNHVTALAMDRSERLWVGTEESGVSRLAVDRSTWTLVNQFDGLPSDSVTVLRAIGDTLWIGTKRGLAIWNGNEITGRLPDGVNPSKFANNQVTGIVVAGDLVWVSTLSGVYRSHISTYLAAWDTVNAGLASTEVDGLAWDGTSLLAIANKVPYVYDAISDQWLDRGGYGYVQRLSDDRGVILASSTNALLRWSGAGWTGVPTLLASSDCPTSDPSCPGLYAFGLDETGRVSAARNDGIHVQRGGTEAWAVYAPPGPPSNNLLNVEVDGDWTYVSTDGGGIGRYDGREWRLWTQDCAACDTVFRYPSRFSTTMFRDREGRKWIGSWSWTLDVMNDRASPPDVWHPWGFNSPHTWTFAAAADSFGGRWLGMDSPDFEDPTNYPAMGLDYYDETGAFVRSYTSATDSLIKCNRIHGLTVDKEGVIWVGFSPGGIARFKPDTSAGNTTHAISLFYLRGNSNNKDLFIQALAAHGDDIWALTTGGVMRLPRAVTDLDDVPVLEIPGQTVIVGGHGIDVTADGSAWAATSAGVRVFHPDGSTEDFNTLNSSLASDMVRSVRVDPNTGVIWFATTGGLSRYDPFYVPPPVPPPPSLEVKLYPNPALVTGAGIALRLSGNVTGFQGTVYDVTGRRLRDFSGTAGRPFWDGRDDRGNLARPGVYLVRVRASGREATLRVVLLR